MATLIQKATKGQRKALQQLYETYKVKVYYSALCLTDENTAVKAVTAAFKAAQHELISKKQTDEAEFSVLFLKKAVFYCKEAIAKKSPKAFRLPKDKNCSVYTDGIEKAENVLDLLPPIQRFSLIVNTVCLFDSRKIAEVLPVDEKTATLLLDAAYANVERLSAKRQNGESLFSVCEKLEKGESEITVPEEADNKVRYVIDRISSPLEKETRKKNQRTGVISGCVLLMIALIVFITVSAANKKTDDSTNDYNDDYYDDYYDDYEEDDETDDIMTTPVIELDEEAIYYADIEIEDYGTVTIELDQNTAPVTVANFVNLAQTGFYDGLTFHRIMEGFMMQGGDPGADGYGGSDTCIVGEFSYNGYENNISHTRGTISMARSNDYNSASSQFFIVQEDSSASLDGLYAAFGHVTEGMEVVDAICEAAEPTDDNGTIPYENQPVILTITIRSESNK